jgi:hypothetical protein
MYRSLTASFPCLILQPSMMRCPSNPMMLLVEDGAQCTRPNEWTPHSISAESRLEVKRRGKAIVAPCHRYNSFTISGTPQCYNDQLFVFAVVVQLSSSDLHLFFVCVLVVRELVLRWLFSCCCLSEIKMNIIYSQQASRHRGLLANFRSVFVEFDPNELHPRKGPLYTLLKNKVCAFITLKNCTQS